MSNYTRLLWVIREGSQRIDEDRDEDRDEDGKDEDRDEDERDEDGEQRVMASCLAVHPRSPSGPAEGAQFLR
ncbi:MAG: hypothetical protein FJ225_09555 [Lentisphaerae bacterium]|nr:hypothetical protein [Lentisphaerota bacterium]